MVGVTTYGWWGGGVTQNLEVLDLSHNQLDSLPYSMGYMKSLQELNLTGNPLRDLYKIMHKSDRYRALPLLVSR